jgi:class 3 adenylate cyclase
MEPRIQYAKTSDGVSIAYWVIGAGEPPLVYMPNHPWSHIQVAWQDLDMRRDIERLAEKRKVIAYDGRGSGLSEREVSDHSLDAQLLDLEGVLDRLGLERFSLQGVQNSGPTAITYAARNPNRLSHLILDGTYARGADFLDIPQLRSLLPLVETDWEMFTETAAHVLTGWSVGEPARRLAAFLRECTTPRVARSDAAMRENLDVTELLPQVITPTLVIQFRQVPFPNIDIARRMASRIPNARLAVLEGQLVVGSEPRARAIDEFLGEGEEAEPKTDLPEGMAVILFADIVGSTALTESLGDAAFRAKARELDTSLREIIHECSGTPVEGKLVGDGVLAVFTSARQAIECALRCNGAGESVGLQLHLGIHAGDVIREGNNVYGGAVNIAARIAAASAPGEVLVSETVRSLARTSAGVSFDDRGEQVLKGVADPQRLFAVRGGGA